MVDRIRLGFTSGMVSVAFWVVVYSPQIWECYVLQSGEGLSVMFLLIWLVGDITGLVGAIVQGLSATISLLAIYYMLCDVVLLSMLFYYRKQRRLYPERFEKNASGFSRRSSRPDEHTPLLPQPEHNSNEQGAVNVRIKSFLKAHRVTILAYTLAAVFITSSGVSAWLSSAGRSGHGHGHFPEDGSQPRLPKEEWSTTAQIFGWTSAFTYLASRVPQIMKNTRTKCQGLSLMMFMTSVLGNLTYCGSILIPSTSPGHVWINLSWLVGSAGTIVLDFIVLGQFIYYHNDRKAAVWIEGGESQFSVSGI